MSILTHPALSQRLRRLMAIGVATAAIGVVAVPAADAQAPNDTSASGEPVAPRACPLPDQRTATDAQGPLFTGTDPDRQILFYAAFRIAKFPCDFPRDFRTIVMYPDALVLVSGGKVERVVPFATGGKAVTFDAVATAIGDPSWIASNDLGQYTVDAAFVQLPGTSLVVTAPRVQELRLTTRPHVFFGGKNATVVFNGVKVTSWDASRNGPDVLTDDGRPFVLYSNASRMDIVDSTFSYLGSDRSGGAYGVAWLNGGTTGSAIGSTFEHNFFGAYTSEAKNVVFRKNKFINNIKYGIDPHDFSTGLVIEDNEASGNGKHGIILSNYCSDTVISGNIVKNNGANGIVIDKVSSKNRIENNTVEDNKGDGIVILDSPNNSITGNTISGNRAGIRVNLPRAADTRIDNNVIDRNVSGMKLEGGARDVIATRNTITGSSEAAILVDAPRTVIESTKIDGGKTGIVLKTLATVRDTDIKGVALGLSLEDDSVPLLQRVAIDSTRDGVRFPQNETIDLSQTTIQAPNTTSIRGVKRSWRRWLPLGGLGLIVIAYVIELLRRSIERAREREAPLREAPVVPSIVLNPT